MSRDDMHRMFTDLAEDVPAPTFAGAAWSRARHVRRRRLVAGAAAVAVLAVLGAVGVVARDGHHATPPVPPIGTPTPSARHGAVDELPARISEQPDGFLPPSFTPPADAPPLHARPFKTVVALYSPPPGDGDALPPLYVYGRYADDTAGWARLPVTLVWATDGANRSLPMRATSLGPQGRWAAFPQPHGLVAVDMATGVTHTIPLAGLMEEVAWLPDGVHVIVSGGAGSYLVDVATDKVSPTTASAWDVVTLYGGDSGTVTWTGFTTSGGPLTLTRYDDPGAKVIGHIAIDQSTIAPYGLSETYGPGTRRGHTLVRAGYGNSSSESGGQYVAAVDGVSGAITRMLYIGFDVPKGCCAVLGWTGDSVVLTVSGRGLLAWNPVDGTVVRLASPADGVISLASYGCDWTLFIDGTGSSCVT